MRTLKSLLVITVIIFFVVSCKLLCDKDDNYYIMPDSKKSLLNIINTLYFLDSVNNIIDTLIINVLNVELECQELREPFKCSWKECEEVQAAYYYRNSFSENTLIGSTIVVWNGNIHIEFDGFRGKISMHDDTIYSGGELETDNTFGNVYVIEDDDCKNDSIPEIVYFSYKYGIIRYKKCDGSVYELNL